MKLASLKNDTRDGQLVVVSKDLTRCSPVGHIASTLQQVLDDWQVLAPRLERVAESLETGAQPTQRFREHEALSPLPRAYQWADGSAYVNHVELVRKARGAQMPASFWEDPLMYQGGSDTFLGPRDPIRMADEAYGIGLANRRCADGEALTAAIAVAEQIASHPQACMLSDRRCVQEAAGKPFSDAMNTEGTLGWDYLQSRGFADGVAKFVGGAGRHGEGS